MRELGRDLGRAQHLSDEAVAAFADDVLTGHARQRARRHTAECAECNHAVAVQREAVWALRAAPAPALPSGLLERLREVPVTTPIRQVPTHVDEHGNTMFASFAAPAAAFVPVQPQHTRRGRHRRSGGRLRRGVGRARRHGGRRQRPEPRARRQSPPARQLSAGRTAQASVENPPVRRRGFPG